MTLRFFIKRIVLFLWAIVASASADWVELKNCRLVKNSFNDGDSFLIESARSYRGRNVNRFRLYFVDAAEADKNSAFKKERLMEQAQYWGQDDPDFALKMGLRADQFVKRLLRGRFTVYTVGEQAPTKGMPRYYALIRVDDRWLNEFLVKEGLARIYGKGINLPDGTAEQAHWNRLRRLERASKTERFNGWSGK